MKTILWLCNTVFSNTDIKKGSWLQPLAEQLQSSGKVNIINVSVGNTSKTTFHNYNGITQWVLPRKKQKCHGQIASLEICKEIRNIIEKENPDLVHIWGTEMFWASVFEQGFIKTKTILDIQGLLYAYTDYYYGGLTFKEILQSIHLKEIIMPWRTLFQKKKVFQIQGKAELKCLKSFKYISVQSNWVKSLVSIENPNAQYYDTKIMLRNAFYKATPWTYKTTNTPVIFSSCASAVSYKGMHVLIKTLTVLKKKYPNIQLNIAGNVNVGNRLLDGYSIFLNLLIRKYNLQKNINYLGSINEHEIIKQLQNCNVCVIPSFIETYCLAFAEAMIIGVPTVASYAGAMPELAKHNEEALFYNSIDYRIAASHVDRLIHDQELSERLSENGRKRRFDENNREAVIKTQLEIYDKILNDK